MYPARVCQRLDHPEPEATTGLLWNKAIGCHNTHPCPSLTPQQRTFGIGGGRSSWVGLQVYGGS